MYRETRARIGLALLVTMVLGLTIWDLGLWWGIFATLSVIALSSIAYIFASWIYRGQPRSDE